MERLTIRDDIGIRVNGCRKHYGEEERKGAYTHNAIVRLAKYEDSGLTPEQVGGIKHTIQHGKWIPLKVHGIITYEKCSTCGERESLGIELKKYCPNCGAKMDL